jgi:phytoene/squalene synthetase
MTGLALYTQAAEKSSAVVIDQYSTSFGWATKLLAPYERQHVRNIYAMVRVADEIVDGAAAEALDKYIGADPHSMRCGVWLQYKSCNSCLCAHCQRNQD